MISLKPNKRSIHGWSRGGRVTKLDCPSHSKLFMNPRVALSQIWRKVPKHVYLQAVSRDDPNIHYGLCDRRSGPQRRVFGVFELSETICDKGKSSAGNRD